MRTWQSRGRNIRTGHAFRTLYQRDRDRIVHSTAFAGSYKTQVCQPDQRPPPDPAHVYPRAPDRAGPSLVKLGLNEDLIEANALMHDLGHPPFGHAGMRLQELMADHGGFEHNWHGLRIVEELEYRYPDFPGLNLSWEVLESQAMHSKAKESPEVKAFVGVGQPLLEAQVVDAADSLAYNTHDIDDALSVGLLSINDLREVTFFREAEARRGRHGNLTPSTSSRRSRAWSIGR